jgi:hypothetical protein
MKSKEWIVGNKKYAGKPISHSGGQGVQLGGFDARNRVIAQPNGVNRTPDIIASPGSHVPQAKEEAPRIVGDPEPNSGQPFRSPAELPAVGWKQKNYTSK